MQSRTAKCSCKLCFPTILCLPSLPSPREASDCLTCHQVGSAPGAQDRIELGLICSQAVLPSCIQLLNRQRDRQACSAASSQTPGPSHLRELGRYSRPRWPRGEGEGSSASTVLHLLCGTRHHPYTPLWATEDSKAEENSGPGEPRPTGTQDRQGTA